MMQLISRNRARFLSWVFILALSSARTFPVLGQASHAKRDPAPTPAIQRELDELASSIAPLDERLKTCKDVQITAHRLHDVPGEAMAVFVYGRFLYEGQEWDSVSQVLESAISLLRNAGMRELEATALIDAGAVDYYLGDRQKALDYDAHPKFWAPFILYGNWR